MMRYRSGDLAAFESLYRRHRDPLYRYFLRSVPQEAVAAELFQESWAAVIGARARYEAQAKFTTWLYRIAHNKLIDHFRQAHPTVSLDDSEEPPAPVAERPDAVAESASTARRLLDALARLPLPQRSAFLLKEEGGMSLEEIADTLGVGRETVKSRLRYALVKLRSELSDVWP
ncbi:MAG: sigma-70 family RNA polymerase sigma factor [Sinimarinibacterium sp.]|jgi:RNA polymerase sigma-70 factor (ECF subfamily)